MNTPSTDSSPVDRPPMNQWLKLALDMGPLMIFFLANSQLGIIPATGVFMAATLVAIVTVFVMTRTVPKMHLVSAAFVLVFGGLTVYMQDETFIKIKPTMVYSLFAVMLYGGLKLGKHPLRYLFDSAIPGMSEEGWRILTVRWSVFFIVMAIANEIAWRNVSTDMWLGMKLWAFLPASLVFAMAQTPLMMKHSDLGKEEPGEGAKSRDDDIDTPPVG